MAENKNIDDKQKRTENIKNKKREVYFMSKNPVYTEEQAAQLIFNELLKNLKHEL